MKTIKKKIKKVMAYIITIAMIVGMMPVVSNDIIKALANGDTEEPRHELSVIAYASRDELMNSFTPNANGESENVGKLIFGKDENAAAVEWYILGKDRGVPGNNITIFATRKIMTGQPFGDETNYDDFPYIASFGTYEINPESVFCNHYGASIVRGVLQGLASNTDFFTNEEQSLMQATTVETYDSKNDRDYTVSDVLYLLRADTADNQIIYAGSYDDFVLPMNIYWNGSIDDWTFWLRSPDTSQRYNVKDAQPRWWSDSNSMIFGASVRPATNINLSSVSFASAAVSPVAGTVNAEVIADDTAMALRLDGSSMGLGSIVCNDYKKILVTTKDENISGEVAIVVQGNDGTKDWYYSKSVDGTASITFAEIKEEVGLTTDINIHDCKVWMETTVDGVIYADDTVTEATSIDNVEITGVNAPTPETELDNNGTTNTIGINNTEPVITWKVDEDTVTGNALYNTTYTAYVTLESSDTYYFDNSVVATINGQQATVVVNGNGTITVSYTFDRTDLGTIGYVVTGYEGTYDGQSHSISVEVTNPSGVTVTYSLDEGAKKVYSETNPTFTNAGEYTVYYKIEKADYETVEGNKTIKINKKAVTITVADQTIIYGDSIDDEEYNVTGLLNGDKFNQITLTPSTSEVTESGTISVGYDKIINSGEDEVTDNYEITSVSGQLVIKNATMEVTVQGYEGVYDGLAHSIIVEVTNPTGATVTYSLDEGDEKVYSGTNPTFTDVGEYTVYYKIEKANYETLKGSKTVTINKKAVIITAADQTVTEGNDIDDSKYTVSGLLDGDRINLVTLTPSTVEVTNNGAIEVSIDKIVNAAGEDVSNNYEISFRDGQLVILESVVDDEGDSSGNEDDSNSENEDSSNNEDESNVENEDSSNNEDGSNGENEDSSDDENSANSESEDSSESEDDANGENEDSSDDENGANSESEDSSESEDDANGENEDSSESEDDTNGENEDSSESEDESGSENGESSGDKDDEEENGYSENDTNGGGNGGNDMSGDELTNDNENSSDAGDNNAENNLPNEDSDGIDEVPSTNDMSSIGLCIVLLLGSIFGIIYIARKRKYI